MSERINTSDNRAAIRWKLLTTASALALTAYTSSTGMAKAEDRPTLWIELGGQMEAMQGLSSPFTAPFMSVVPPSGIYDPKSFTQSQRMPRFAFGAEGKISFQPQNSDWTFSAGIRYGRSHAKRLVHHQSAGVAAVFYTFFSHQPYATVNLSTAVAFQDVTTQSSERHAIVDFSAGKDVGLGLLGREGSSNLSAGVRLVDVKDNSAATIYARPAVTAGYAPPKYSFPEPIFTQYTLTGHAERSFKGMGPSLAWTASAALIGNKEDGEVTLDWGINGAILFGKQKAKVRHSTLASYYNGAAYYNAGYQGPAYPSRNVNTTRERSVAVPNVGGLVGLSVRYPNVKVSIGYRADFFLNAMDTGIDTAKKSNLSFNGPFASISIGVGN